MAAPPDARDVAIGLAAVGGNACLSLARLALMPARLALRAPIVGDVVDTAMQRAASDLAHQGELVRARTRATIEATGDEILAAPEVEHAIDTLLAGPLMDAVGRSLAEHHVVERIAAQVLIAADVDQIVGTVLDHEKTEQAVDRVLESPGLERLVVRVLESKVLEELTEQVLRSPEMDQVVGYVASSPQVVDAITRHTQSLAEEMVTDVRRRTHRVDDITEKAVRGWLRRPRPEPT